MRKVLGDLETLAKHTHYIANDYAKLHEKFTKMTEQCHLKNVIISIIIALITKSVNHDDLPQQFVHLCWEPSEEKYVHA